MVTENFQFWYGRVSNTEAHPSKYRKGNSPLRQETSSSGRSEHYGKVQWNLIIKRSDITKSSYNKVILLVPVLYIS